LDFVAGLAATVGLPTGSSDPFAIRRAVLGLVAEHRTSPVLRRLWLAGGFAAAVRHQPVEPGERVLAELAEFLAGRLEQQLVEEGQP
ncbi:glycine--tRNA ligase subunit beta, partial [Klebsiella pneumoniae]|uniref:glycine--tRNA ligase subunit beta n=1 Tax=Klebsiella pneumoniae TaxID=573 RepID=UPI00226E8E1F